MPEHAAGPPPEPYGHPRHAEHGHIETRARWAWWAFAAIALFYLVAEHRAHLFGVLPYVLLLACPMMHLFMHHGHRHQKRGSGNERPRKSDDAAGGQDEPR